MPKSIALMCAVTTCNVSYARQIDETTLMSILSGVQPVNPWLSHIGTFFNEANEKHIKGVSEECGIPMDQLAKVFYSLPVTYQESNFPKIYYGK